MEGGDGDMDRSNQPVNCDITGSWLKSNAGVVMARIGRRFLPGVHFAGPCSLAQQLNQSVRSDARRFIERLFIIYSFIVLKKRDKPNYNSCT